MRNYNILLNIQNMECNSIKVRPKKHWSLGLLESMKDPSTIYKETDNVVIIKDKYPKAKVHYLVLPRDNISSIFKLEKSHIPLLQEFGSLFNDIQKEHSNIELKAGFHSIPSMERMHMHIISTDMISACLKTKIHWNSFTTGFFLPYKDVLKSLKENGCINKISTEKHKSFMSTALKCNQCTFLAKNMPQLKTHLLTHS